MAWVFERSGTRGTKYAGIYRDPDGHKRSAGTYSSRREALRAANREEQKVLSGTWHDGSLGQITFRDYVEGEWLPHKHLELTTRAAYNSYLNKQFYPAFGRRQLNKVSPSVVQDWVTKAHAEGLLAPVDQEVPRVSVLDLSSRGSRPDPRFQPVRPHRTAQGDPPQVTHGHP